MIFTILSIIIAIASVITVIVICLQEAKSSGLGAGIAGGSETYWSKNKARTKEGRLVRVTVIAAIVFFVAAILLNVGALVNPSVASDVTDTEAVVEEVTDAADDESEKAGDDAEAAATDEETEAEADEATEAESN